MRLFQEKCGVCHSKNYEGDIIYINEGDRISIGDDELEIFFHSRSFSRQYQFYNKDAKFIVSGDVLFRSGIGRTDLPGGDFDTLVESIRNKLFTLPDDVIVYSGHGP
jgi:hypothetical protein